MSVYVYVRIHIRGSFSRRQSAENIARANKREDFAKILVIGKSARASSMPLLRCFFSSPPPPLRRPSSFTEWHWILIKMCFYSREMMLFSLDALAGLNAPRAVLAAFSFCGKEFFVGRECFVLFIYIDAFVFVISAYFSVCFLSYYNHYKKR